MDNFKKWVAAVTLAQQASNGSGEPNHYDHVAKDLHEDGYLERLDELSEDDATRCVRLFDEEIMQLSRKYRSQRPC